MPATVPPAVQALFWEELDEEIDPDRHSDYIAVRVLEAGDEPAVRWLLERFDRERLRAIVTSGRLRPRQAEFWRAMLGDGRDERPG